MNNQENIVSVVLMYENYASEIHQYNLSSGKPIFMYELQGDLINVHDLYGKEQTSYVLFENGTEETTLVSINSKTW